MSEIWTEIVGGLIVAFGVWFIARLYSWRIALWPVEYRQGWYAENAGRPRKANPYKSGSMRWMAWDEGWRDSEEQHPYEENQ